MPPLDRAHGQVLDMKSHRVKPIGLFLVAVALSVAIGFMYGGDPKHLGAEDGVSLDDYRNNLAVLMGLVVVGLVLAAASIWRQTK